MSDGQSGKANQDGTVTLVGLDRADNIPPRTQEVLRAAALIAGPARWLDELRDLPGERLPLEGGGLEPWLKEIETRSRGLPTAVLASGDPNFYGVARKLLTIVPRDRVRIIPGTTTVQKAFARLRVSWADVPVVSLHGRGFPRGFFPALYRAGLGSSPGYLAVYTDPVNTPASIALRILGRGLDGWRMTVCEDLDLESERVTTLSLQEASGAEFSDLNLTILEREIPFPPIRIGAPEMDFAHEEGMITKSEVRAVALSKLSLTGAETLWDIGAGSGAVAIEAASLLPHGEVWGIERKASRHAQARRNAALYGAANVCVMLGEAEALIPELPKPDRVFLGGGGSGLGELIAAARGRLNPGGVVVASVVGLGSLDQAVRALVGPHGLPDVTQVMVSRSHPLADSFYFRPLNPVYLVRGEFP
ncbi:MAG: precorrin-6y C5,15-methyltransferase (decarboxylating) subunit CbiE [Deltaproteobacteria bacterium]|jgi:precorrin-6Y C5,15-methyltransferase (decarboxylating)|nr:precorrin-6y C5,15-methyltransferase (decarboxylating) subunit CbiE [Deltaproteobacteria bacterium]